MSKIVNCWNDFYEERFDAICKELELGEHVKAIVDCIGHTRNNMVQNIYKEALEKTYGDRLLINAICSDSCFSYEYYLLY